MKILFVGASGYGNMGDDCYKHILGENLDHELLFDSPYPDLRAVEWCDHMVVGCGGLIYVSQTAHLQYMAMYLHEAVRLKKPFSFLCVGVQFYPQDEKNLIQVLDPWKKFLMKAELITVRSPTDKAYLEELSGKTCHYYPDLGYLIKPVDYHLTLPNAHVFSITGLSLKDGGAWRELDISLASGKPIYTVAMSKDDAVNTEKFLEKVPQEGNGIINRENLTPHECARIFLDADRVVTARYHGMIFTRAVGKEAVSIDKRYKSTHEVKPKDKMDAFKHIELLRTVL